MQLKETIYCRKSFRSYNPTPLDAKTLQEVNEFIEKAERLFPQFSLEWDIVDGDSVKCVLPWRAPHNLAIYAEETTDSLVNVGFVFQQLDLYLQSRGIGTCWLGMGKPNEYPQMTEEKKCVMMLAFGSSEENFRTSKEEFKRKSLAEISDTEDTSLEGARLAPSAINSQPWYFIHGEQCIHAYCIEKYLRKIVLGNMNKIDMGIALAHIYVENKDTFKFFKSAEYPAVKGYYYIGSFKI